MLNYIKKIAPLETFLGFVIIVLSGIFLYWASSVVKVTSANNDSYYKVSFQNSSGLQVGADVKINGVKVGSVLSKELDPETYMAYVKFSVPSKYKVPVDSKVKIASESLLGSSNLIIEIGKSEFYLGDSDVVEGEITPSLEDVIGNFIFSMNNGSKK